MHINSRASAWKNGLQHRADMMVTGVDWHEEIRCTIDSTTDGTHPLFVKSENCGEVAVRDDINQRLAIFRRGCRMLRFVGLHFEFRVLRSATCLRCGYRLLILGERTAQTERK